MRAHVTAAVALGVVSTLALADSGAEGVRLDYQADARCPGQDAFVAEVHARSPRVRFVPDASRTLVVRVEPHGQRLAGRIELGSTQRSVQGATCEEVLSALGLVTALALDPLGVTSGGNSGSADAGTGTGATSGSDAGTTATTDAGASSGTETDAASPWHDDDERQLPVEKRTWSFAAGADVEAVFGVSPDPLFAVPVFFEATRALSENVGIGGALRFARAGETSLDASGVGADFTWTAGALDLCFVARSGRFRLNACERTTVGAIDAQGIGIIPSRSATRPWVDLGLALSLRVRVAGPVFIEAAGHFGLALVQDRFFIEPDVTVFQASLVTAHAGGGLGFEIW